MTRAARRCKAAYEAGEAGMPCPAGSDARERRVWMLGRGRHAANGMHDATQAANVDLLDRLDALAKIGTLTDDEKRERDALRARLGLPR